MAEDFDPRAMGGKFLDFLSSSFAEGPAKGGPKLMSLYVRYLSHI